MVGDKSGDAKPRGRRSFLGCHNADGGFVGGQVGYRWQSSAWVFGLEAQGDWARFRGSNPAIPFPAITATTRVRDFGLFTGQVGYAWNNALLYAKGGAAVIDNRYAIVATATGVTGATASDSQWGGTVGVGLEYGFMPNWSVAVEYDHIFVRDQTSNFIVVGGGAFSSNSPATLIWCPRGSIIALARWAAKPRRTRTPKGSAALLGAALSFECPIVSVCATRSRGPRGQLGDANLKDRSQRWRTSWERPRGRRRCNMKASEGRIHGRILDEQADRSASAQKSRGRGVSRSPE